MKSHGLNEDDKPNDAIQWILEAALSGTSIPELCSYILYIQFSALHTSTACMTNVLLDLATHPKFQDPLKTEINTILETNGGWSKEAIIKMRKLDSALRETERLNPINTGREPTTTYKLKIMLTYISATMMRKSLVPYILADGTHLPEGQWVVAPGRAINRASHAYSNPEEYDAFRFSDLREAPSEVTRYQRTTSGEGFTSFGGGKHACPGRFFAAMELKTILAYIITKYEFRLGDEKEVKPERPKTSFVCFTSFADSEAPLMLKRRPCNR
ncbi:hypothetical protein FQN54_008075 [Arachnomyces sp. PD_36]|nr:hypothetical protein FQN54_008075 [Arachnomyces sp. PD_36]